MSVRRHRLAVRWMLTSPEAINVRTVPEAINVRTVPEAINVRAVPEAIR